MPVSIPCRRLRRPRRPTIGHFLAFVEADAGIDWRAPRSSDDRPQEPLRRFDQRLGYHFGAMTIAEKQSQTACFLCCLYRALAAIGHCVMLKTHNKPQYVQFGKGWLRPLRGSRGKQFEIVPFPHPLTAQEAGKALQDWKGAVVEENKTSKPSTGQ